MRDKDRPDLEMQKGCAQSFKGCFIGVSLLWGLFWGAIVLFLVLTLLSAPCSPSP